MKVRQRPTLGEFKRGAIRRLRPRLQAARNKNSMCRGRSAACWPQEWLEARRSVRDTCSNRDAAA